MSNSKLYVGNLTFDVSEQDLRDLFSQVGEVRDAAVVTDKFTGRSRGFGFVTLSDSTAADAACKRFDKRDFQGRSLTVNIARPREDSFASSGGSRSFQRR